MRVWQAGLALFLSILPLAPAQAAEKMPVVATFSILGDMIQQVGGEDIALTTLVGPEADAHSYTPTAADIKAVQQARIVVANGLGFEPWLDKMLSAANYQGLVVLATNGITPRLMEEDAVKVTDPHAWQNLAHGRLYVRNIASALAQADPAHAANYQSRAQAYDQELAQLQAEVEQMFAALPAARRTLITSHDAFGYFGEAYGLTFLAPAGLSTEDEPSATAIAQLMDQLKHQQVRTVFLENMSNPRLVTQMAADAGVKLGGTLYADALSAPTGEASSYLALFRHNAQLLVAALQAP